MRICLECQHELATTQSQWQCAQCGYQPPQQGEFIVFSQALADYCEGFDAQLFAQMAALEEKHFWFRSRNRLIQWALGKYFPQCQDLLEIGCGTGFVLDGLRKAYPHLNCYGSEAMPDGLSFAAKRLPGVPLWQMDARYLPFRSEFDVIGAFDVIEHIEEDTAVLMQMRQAIKSDGGILLTVPQHPWLWSEHDEVNHHVRRYEAQDLKQKVEQAGFKVELMTSFVSLLLPALMMSRLSEKMKAGKPQSDNKQTSEKHGLDKNAEFQISPLVNSIGETAMAIEMSLIQSGARFPMGSSLLLVAKAL